MSPRGMICCLLLLFFATTTLQGAPPDAEDSPALRAIRSSGIVDVQIGVLRETLAIGHGQSLAEVVLSRDSSLLRDLEQHYRKQLDQALEPEPMKAVAEFFESPTGKAYREAFRKAVAGQDPGALLRDPFSGLAPEDPRRHLVDLLGMPWAVLEATGKELGTSQMDQVIDFFEGPHGLAWQQALQQITQNDLETLAPSSPTRRSAALGCAIALSRSRVEYHFGPEPVTTEELRRVLPAINLGMFERTCDCVFGELIEEMGTDVMLQLNTGDPRISERLGELMSSGVCRPNPASPEAKSDQAIREIYSIGTGLYAWLADNILGSQSEILRSEDGWSAETTGGGEVAQFVQVSADEVEKLLVPRYLRELPKVDPWGQPYEFAINRSFLVDHVISVRSAGNDGTFAEGPYPFGPFPTTADGKDHDIVWADGYFTRWPEDD